MNPTPASRHRMLAVDDEPHVLSALRRALRHHFGDRLELETFDDPLAALARSRECEFAARNSLLSLLESPVRSGVESHDGHRTPSVFRLKALAKHLADGLSNP